MQLGRPPEPELRWLWQLRLAVQELLLLLLFLLGRLLVRLMLLLERLLLLVRLLEALRTLFPPPLSASPRA